MSSAATALHKPIFRVTPRFPKPKKASKRTVYVWNRGELLTLAETKCTKCFGVGALRTGPCGCVLRKIFRICFRKWTDLQSEAGNVRGVHWNHLSGGTRTARCYGRKNEEFLADFYLIAKRTLSQENWQILRLHYLLGWSYREVCAALPLEAGTFYHRCYQVEEALGAAFRQTRPYALFPLREYFGQ
jgi:hypothetical protein